MDEFFNAHPELDLVFVTSDSMKFPRRADALAHARSLADSKINTARRHAPEEVVKDLGELKDQGENPEGDDPEGDKKDGNADPNGDPQTQTPQKGGGGETDVTAGATATTEIQSSQEEESAGAEDDRAENLPEGEGGQAADTSGRPSKPNNKKR